MPYTVEVVTIEVVTVGCGGNGEPSTIIDLTKQGGMYMLSLTVIHNVWLWLYMLGAKRGFGQSTDCAAQSMDLCFARRSTDCLLNPWIA